jgi:hypothetical protein
MQFLKRLGNVFTAPDACFTSIRDEKKSWTDYVIPILLLTAMIITFLILTAEIVEQEQINAIRKMPQLTEEQKEAAIQQSSTPLMSTLKYVSGILSNIIAVLFTALVFWIVGNFIGGGEQKFSTLLVTTLYIQLITIPESIIKLILIMQKEILQVYVGLASLVTEPELGSFGFQFLAQFEFFKIWRILLWVIAFKVLYRYTAKKSAILVVVTMLIGMLLAALIGSMQMGQMG